jgi:hypothetical protein
MGLIYVTFPMSHSIMGRIYVSFKCRKFPTLVPRPHPQRMEKGLVNLDTILGPGKGIWALQWDCSFSVVIWLANRRNAKRYCQLYKFESSAHARSRPWPIRSKVVSALQCRRAPTEPAKPAKPRNVSKFTRPLSLLWGWGLGTRL